MDLVRKYSEYTCIICQELKPKADGWKPSPKCNHLADACLNCLRTMVEGYIGSKKLNGIKCPSLQCRAVIEPKDMKMMCSEETFARSVDNNECILQGS